MLRRLAAAIAIPVLFSCATAQPPAFRLRRVVLYQNGIGHFERTGRLTGTSLALTLGAHEVDDALKTLTVVEQGARSAAAGRTGVMAIVPRRASGREHATVSVRFGHRPVGDVSVAYAVPTPTWRAAYRVVLPDRRGTHDGWLQAWALVHNVSSEDWRDVHLTLASSGPLSYAVDLQRPQFVARPDATGRLVEPTATGPVGSERTHAVTDADGVADEDDLCWTDPEDRDGFEDGDGCPDPDNDSDRVLDIEDQCPNDPEIYNGETDEDGCPDQGRVVIEESNIVILDKIYFTPGSAEIRAPSRPILDAIAATLVGNPQIQSVEVQGHASNGERDPWGLSAARARAVRQALLDRRVEADRLVAVPYGDAQPIDARRAPAAAERNRRVEFLIVALDEGSGGPARGTTRTESTTLTAEAIARGARASATPTEIPGGTQYGVSEAVTIPAGASTLVTILNRRLSAEDVLLFRPGDEVRGSDRHPLRAARVVNDTPLDLVPGPVALFGRGAFVGEGILDGLGAGENAFVPYALDRSTSVAVQVDDDEEPTGVVSLARGVLVVQSSGIRRTRYIVDAGGRPPARLFVRHLRAQGHDVATLPPGTERMPGALLVPVPLTAGRTSTVTIEERRPLRRSIQLLSDRSTDLGPYLSARPLRPEQEEVLRPLVEQRLELGRLESEAIDLRTRLADAGARSAELRETLASLGRTGAAATALRRQVLERLRDATRSSEDLSTRLAATTLAASEARARLEQLLADQSLADPSLRATSPES